MIWKVHILRFTIGSYNFTPQYVLIKYSNQFLLILIFCVFYFYFNFCFFVFFFFFNSFRSFRSFRSFLSHQLSLLFCSLRCFSFLFFFFFYFIFVFFFFPVFSRRFFTSACVFACVACLILFLCLVSILRLR